jgi:hypothetical protein
MGSRYINLLEFIFQYWKIQKCEHYFSVYQVMDWYKVELLAMHLRGRAGIYSFKEREKSGVVVVNRILPTLGT